MILSCWQPKKKKTRRNMYQTHLTKSVTLYRSTCHKDMSSFFCERWGKNCLTILLGSTSLSIHTKVSFLISGQGTELFRLLHSGETSVVLATENATYKLLRASRLLCCSDWLTMQEFTSTAVSHCDSTSPHITFAKLNNLMCSSLPLL